MLSSRQSCHTSRTAFLLERPASEGLSPKNGAHFLVSNVASPVAYCPRVKLLLGCTLVKKLGSARPSCTLLWTGVPASGKSSTFLRWSRRQKALPSRRVHSGGAVGGTFSPYSVGFISPAGEQVHRRSAAPHRHFHYRGPAFSTLSTCWPKKRRDRGPSRF